MTDPDDQLARLEDSLAEEISRTGEESEETAIARRDFAAALEQVGRLEEAVAVRQRLLETVERQLGTEHRLVAQQELHVADNLRHLGRLDEARAYAEHALNVFGSAGESDEAWLLATKKCLSYIEEAATPRRKRRNVRTLSMPTSRGTYEGTPPTTYLTGKLQPPQGSSE
jgi:hypothetical protein